MGVSYSSSGGSSGSSGAPASNTTEEKEPLKVGENWFSHHHVKMRIDLDQDCTVVPVTRYCFYCCDEGKEHPIEHFVRYPCCGYYLCRDCMWKNTGSCLECITIIPSGNEYALPWIGERINKKLMRARDDHSRYMHLLGKIHINGSHLFLDELLLLPVYQYKKLEPRSAPLSIMNPSNVQEGLAYLEHAATDESISAMLDLADTYCTNFVNDSFGKDKEKAEHWYVKALGKGNRICPLAFTRYGDFLMWEQRFVEAQNMYQIAATNGHARGQYQYAVCLLSGNTVGGCHDGSSVSNDDTENAIQFLCKASQKGFYAPSYTLLAKILIGIAEKAYGTVYAVGRSPLPRTIQILALAKDCPYGTSQACKNETLTLVNDYGLVQEKCSNCGKVGSEMHPLRPCGICGVVAYCSNVCLKRDYRDGHKFDCCSSEILVNFQSIRLTLPWVSKVGWKGGIEEMPSLHNTGERSLVQMVEDETDELYGEDDQDYDEDVLINLMFRMRKNLETYLNKELQDRESASITLQNQITRFSERIQEYPGWQDFIQAMDIIRTLGNNAAHSQNSDDENLAQVQCEDAVREYRAQKENYEKYRETVICHDEGNMGASMSVPKHLDALLSSRTSKEGDDNHADNTILNTSHLAALCAIPLQNDGRPEKKSNKSKRKKKKRKKQNKTSDGVQFNNTKENICHVESSSNTPMVPPKPAEISPPDTFPKEDNEAHITLNDTQCTATLSTKNEKSIEMKSNKPKKKGGKKKKNKQTINDIQLNDTKQIATTENTTTVPKALDTLSSNKIPKGGTNDECKDNTTQSTATPPEIGGNIEQKRSKSNSEKTKRETIDDAYSRETNVAAVTKKHDASEMEHRTKKNGDSPSIVQIRLDKYIAANNLVGIEQIISEWNGVSGYAKLRKRAKGAAKKLKNKDS